MEDLASGLLWASDSNYRFEELGTRCDSAWRLLHLETPALFAATQRIRYVSVRFSMFSRAVW